MQRVLLLIVGLAAAIAVACGSPAGSVAPDRPYKPLSCLAPTCEEVTVKSGDVTLSVVASGSLRYINNVDLRFLSSATVISVNVEVGDVVSEGQVLASLDPSSLELEVTAAKVAVREAEEALEKLLEPPTSEELRAAEAAVAEAKLDVAEAKLKLKLAETGATKYELADAELDVKSAEFALQEDRKDLEDFMSGATAQEIAQAQQTQAEAEVALKDAESALAGLAQDMVQELIQRRQDKADTEVALNQILDKLEDFELQYQNDLAQALQTEASAEVALTEAEDSLSDYSFSLNITVSFNTEAIEDMRRLTVVVEQARANLNTARDEVSELEKGPDPLLRQQLEAAVESDRANLGEIQKGLDIPGNSASASGKPQVRSAVEAAKTRLAVAEEALASLSSDATQAEVASRQADLSAALAILAAEKQSLAALEAGVYPYEVELQVADLFLARANLEDALQQLVELQSGPDPVGLALKEAQVVLSEANLVKALEDLAKMTSGPVPEDLELAHIELALVQVKVPASEETLRLLMEDLEELDVELARKKIEVSLDELAVAERNLINLTIVAPFDGIVSSVNFAPGLNIYVGTGPKQDPIDRLIQLVDSSVLEMVGLVDESDVGRVAIGQEATISVNALPGIVVHGTVAGISAVAIGGERGSGGDRALYQVNISASVEQVTNLNLLEGMTASVDILIERRADVLYIPVAGLNGDDQPTVELVGDGTVTFASVTPGLRNHRRVEIKSGLKEGDTVRVNRSKGNTLPTY